MRIKQEKLVITFRTTTDAMEMESLCRENGAPGRMIPVPREISAGCGLSWCADPAQRSLLLSLCADRGLEPEGVHLCMV